jgi:serine/threonine-protein kinase
MASIHLGRLVGPAGFSRIVALKVLHPLYADAEHYTMLLDEARLSASVRHPNVVQTLDVVHDERHVCIVMEYVHGLDLATAVSAARNLDERMPPAVASAILVGVLHGLHAAHEARGEDGRPLGLVHRDVSPQNVVVGVDGMARVLDFGIAKALRKNHVTAEGRVKGKIAYIAPEQLVGAALTRQADVYAAGVVLWEALAGRHLFDEPNEGALVSRVLEGQVPPPSAFAPNIGAALDAIVLRAVATERRDRFATAQEMAAALADAVPPASNEEVTGWLDRAAGDAIEARTEQLREAEGFTADESRDAVGRRVRRPLAIAALALVPVGTILVLAFAFAARHAPETATTSAEGPSAPAVASLPTTVASAPEDESAPPEPTGTTLVLAPVEVPASPQPGTHTPAHREPARATRVAKCDPPYSVDANGLKHYKAACLK